MQALDSPLGYLLSQNHCAGNSPAQFNQSRNRGCGRVYVRRIQAIGKILGPTIPEKEAFAPELITAAKRTFSLFRKFSARPLRTLRLSGEMLFRLSRKRLKDSR